MSVRIAYDFLVSYFMSVEHYENFPVASLLMPARLRPAVKAIYAFARSADDIADEGDAPPQERLAALGRYVEELNRLESGIDPITPLFLRLRQTIREFRLPYQPFHDLLSAFQQDVVTTRYATFDDLKDYCRRSANPVGRLMLHLYGAAGEQNLRDADAICTALQLINFWQDVAVDWQKERIYLPREDMDRFGVTESHIAEQTQGQAWRGLMRFETERARTLMLSGSALPLRLGGRIGWELRMIVQGGLRILDRIEQADFDVFAHRPVLGPQDWLVMAWRAIFMPA
jgi:squalene synthase HpnC